MPALFPRLFAASLCLERTAGPGFEYGAQPAFLSCDHADGPGLDTGGVCACCRRFADVNFGVASLTPCERSGILFSLGIRSVSFCAVRAASPVLAGKR